MDCSDATDEQMAYMRWAMTGEGLTALLTYMEKEGIDPQKHGVEFMRYEPILHGRGLDVSDEGETSVPGLFAAGDLVAVSYTHLVPIGASDEDTAVSRKTR